MNDLRQEPSMEEILASIKRVIADDSAAAAREPRARVARGGAQPAAAQPQPAPEPTAKSDAPTPEEVFELTEPAPAATPAPAPPAPEGIELLSRDAAIASRKALETLSALVVKTEGIDNTLDGLVREMLRPMLKEWLDARLPELVEGLVQREIARITGRSL